MYTPLTKLLSEYYSLYPINLFDQIELIRELNELGLYWHGDRVDIVTSSGVWYLRFFCKLAGPLSKPLAEDLLKELDIRTFDYNLKLGIPNAIESKTFKAKRNRVDKVDDKLSVPNTEFIAPLIFVAVASWSIAMVYKRYKK